MAAAAYTYHGSLLPSVPRLRQNLSFYSSTSSSVTIENKGSSKGKSRHLAVVRCSIGIEDFIGGDLVKFDLGQWSSDVEEHKALAIYSPHEAAVFPSQRSTGNTIARIRLAVDK
ncbi:unnamed protein product [Fraxinus pennsylvanica]|uniref:Uncharacterized protein n=1 Tax=Fraxinus pennsylvanica TaxID=56036 RepID=A0AAD2E0I9_9LAMI|nr:unnamed protein product [Fraxinus pennsylvanica]